MQAKVLEAELESTSFRVSERVPLYLQCRGVRLVVIEQFNGQSSVFSRRAGWFFPHGDLARLGWMVQGPTQGLDTWRAPCLEICPALGFV